MKRYSYILAPLILSLGMSSNTFAYFSCKNAEQIKAGVSILGVDESRIKILNNGSYFVPFYPYSDQDQLITFSVDEIQASNEKEAIENAKAILGTLVLSSSGTQKNPNDSLPCNYSYTDSSDKTKTIESGAFAWVAKKPN